MITKDKKRKRVLILYMVLKKFIECSFENSNQELKYIGFKQKLEKGFGFW